MSVQVLDLELDGANRAALVQALATGGNLQLERMLQRIDRAFLLKSEWAPGLRFVGAQARFDGTSGPRRMSFGGCGLSVEDALASCLGEAAERLSQIECDGDIWFDAPVTDARHVSAATAELALAALDHSGHSSTEACDWIRAHDDSGNHTAVPADWCLRRPKPGPYAIAGAMLSVGCAAGAKPEDARARAFLELIERDAVSLWWEGGSPPAELPMANVPAASFTLSALREASASRLTTLLDLTTDTQIPVVAAFSTDTNGSGFVCGFAARQTVDEAARAAIVEMCQMEVGLQLAVDKRHHLGDSALTDDDRSHLNRAETVRAATDNRFLLRKAKAERGHAQLGMVNKPIIEALASVYYVELRRPDIDVPVIKAVAPLLQLAPCAVRTSRLASMQAAHAPDAPAASLF